jgi:hypothetical protein
MKTRIIAIIIGPIIGAILGYFFGYANYYGWIGTSWHLLDKPPVEVTHLVAVDSFSLLVQSKSGSYYINENTSTCESGCWKMVPNIPLFPNPGSEETITSEACSSPPPLSDVRTRISQCRINFVNWGLNRNFIYALRNDGTIYLWHTDIYTGEGEDLYNIVYVCFGGIAFFIPILILVLFFEFIDRLSNHAKKQKKEININL